MPLFLGTSADDSLTGSTASDVIAGYDGNDTIDDGGGPGADELFGGRGDDTYIVRLIGSTIVEFLDEGTDTVRTALPAYRIAANIENLTFTGAANFAGEGNASDNVIAGGGGDDALSGFEGSDYLIGGAGNDRLDGGNGVANQMQGGVGDDTYIVSAVGDSVTEFAGEGTDLVRTTIGAYLIGENIENLFYDGTSDFIGRGNASNNIVVGRGGNDSLFGFEGSDYLIGGAGDDLLDGGVGAANALQGGTGNDTYVVGALGDTVTEFGGQGIDSIRTALDRFLLPFAVENLTFTGSGAFIGFGNDSNNTIIGGAGNDALVGAGGRDILIGGAGDDMLTGNFGTASELYGGSGNDAYFSEASDTIIEEIDGGIDTVITNRTSYVLPANVENLASLSYGAFSNPNTFVGNALSNILTGSYGSEYFDGSIGAPDTFVGGDGNDTYVVRHVGDLVVELRGDNTRDTVRTALTTYALPRFVEYLIYTGTADFTGATNIDGESFIVAGPGNDDLTSNGLFDKLEGGAGNDIYRGVRDSTIIYENAGGGIDTIYASGEGRFFVTENAENFYWTGGTRQPGTINGNSSDNIISVRGTITQTQNLPTLIAGRDGNDTLIGGEFYTQFWGGNGNDICIGSTGLFIDDFVFFKGDTGVDRIMGFQSGTDVISITRTFQVGTFSTTFALAQGAGTVATVASQTFVHDTTTGLLSFDPDGSGSLAAIPLAYLNLGTMLAPTDFIVI